MSEDVGDVEAAAHEPEPRQSRIWLTTGNHYLGSKVRRTMLDSDMQVVHVEGTVVGWLPPDLTEDNVSLWNIRYDSLLDPEELEEAQVAELRAKWEMRAGLVVYCYGSGAWKDKKLYGKLFRNSTESKKESFTIFDDDNNVSHSLTEFEDSAYNTTKRARDNIRVREVMHLWEDQSLRSFLTSRFSNCVPTYPASNSIADGISEISDYDDGNLSISSSEERITNSEPTFTCEEYSDEERGGSAAGISPRTGTPATKRRSAGGSSHKKKKRRTSPPGREPFDAGVSDSKRGKGLHHQLFLAKQIEIMQSLKEQGSSTGTASPAPPLQPPRKAARSAPDPDPAPMRAGDMTAAASMRRFDARIVAAMSAVCGPDPGGWSFARPIHDAIISLPLWSEWLAAGHTIEQLKRNVYRLKEEQSRRPAQGFGAAYEDLVGGASDSDYGGGAPQKMRKPSAAARATASAASSPPAPAPAPAPAPPPLVAAEDAVSAAFAAIHSEASRGGLRAADEELLVRAVFVGGAGVLGLARVYAASNPSRFVSLALTCLKAAGGMGGA